MTRSTVSRSSSQETVSRHGEAGSPDLRRLVYVPADDLDRWQCRPLGSVDILDLKDRRMGRLNGIVVDRHENRPIFLVIDGGDSKEQQAQHRFLVPVGDAWFDDTQRAVRIDAPRWERIPFGPDEFERMTPEQADEYERRVLATCCPEVGFHRDGRPDYARLERFTCPVWLRPPVE